MTPDTLQVNSEGLDLLHNAHAVMFDVYKEEALVGNEIKEDGVLTPEYGLLSGKKNAALICPTATSLKDAITQYSEDKSEKNLKENVETTFEKYEEIDFWGMIKEIKNVLKTTAIKIVKIVSGWFAGWVKSL